MKDERITCFYCGKVIESIFDNNNADDWVHPETVGKRCCGDCNATIVVPIRFLAHYKENLKSEE